MELIYLNDLIVENGILQNDVEIDSNWIYSQQALDEYSDEGLLYITQDNYIRRIVNDDRIKMLKDLLTRVGIDGTSLPYYKYDLNMNNGGWGTNEDANDELHELMKHQYLNYKIIFDAIEVNKKLYSYTLNYNSKIKPMIVLNFFIKQKQVKYLEYEPYDKDNPEDKKKELTLEEKKMFAKLKTERPDMKFVYK